MSVGLLGNQFEIVDDFLLESVLYHFQPEAHGGRKGIEVEHARFVAVPDLLFAGCGIRQREVRAWNHRARGVGHHALNGSSILRVRHGGGKDDAGNQRNCAECGRSGTVHDAPWVTQNFEFTDGAFTKTLQKRFSNIIGPLIAQAIFHSQAHCFQSESEGAISSCRNEFVGLNTLTILFG